MTATKSASSKVEYLQTNDARAKATEFLAGASSLTEVAGRSVALLAMARLADEDVVAASQRSFHELRFGQDLPWGSEALALLDELLVERLPEHLTTRLREKSA